MDVLEFKVKDLGSDKFIKHLNGGGKCRVKLEYDCDGDEFVVVCDFVKEGDEYVLSNYFEDGELIDRCRIGLDDLNVILSYKLVEFVNDSLEIYLFGYLEC